MGGQNEYGEIMRVASGGTDRLVGVVEIGEYAGFKDSRTLKALIRSHAFPMALIGGVWVSSRVMVDDWRRRQIRQYLLENAEPSEQVA